MKDDTASESYAIAYILSSLLFLNLQINFSDERLFSEAFQSCLRILSNFKNLWLKKTSFLTDRVYTSQRGTKRHYRMGKNLLLGVGFVYSVCWEEHLGFF